MTRKEIYLYFLNKLQQEFPGLDFSEQSMLSKFIVEPLAVSLEDVFNLIEEATNLSDDNLRLLQAQLYGIDINIKESEPGLIEIDATGDTDIRIPVGTIVTDIDTGATAVVIEEMHFTKEEIISLRARDIKIKVPFRGDLPVGTKVMFSAPVGEYSSAVVVKEYKQEDVGISDEELDLILSNRPLIYGDTTREAIEKKLTGFNAQVLDAMNPRNPILLFDTRKTVNKYRVILYNRETRDIKDVNYEIEIDNDGQIFYGIDITP